MPSHHFLFVFGMNLLEFPVGSHQISLNTELLLVFRETFLEFGWELYEIMIFLMTSSFFLWVVFHINSFGLHLENDKLFNSRGIFSQSHNLKKIFQSHLFFCCFQTKNICSFHTNPGKKNNNTSHWSRNRFCGLPLVGFRWFGSAALGVPQGDDVYVYGWTFEESVSRSGGGWVSWEFGSDVCSSPFRHEKNPSWGNQTIQMYTVILILMTPGNWGDDPIWLGTTKRNSRWYSFKYVFNIVFTLGEDSYCWWKKSQTSTWEIKKKNL